MAETKYDLLLVNTKQDKKIYNQPWYKERLIKTRYIKSLKPTDTSKILVSKNWTFIKDGLDDFRDGLPAPVGEDGIFLKGSKGLQPVIQGSSKSERNVKQSLNTNRFTKEEICFSRVTPLQQQRRDHIDEIEYGLTQHPLALYPHLEECMPPDVFEDVVDILDPEMKIDSDDEESSYSSSNSDDSLSQVDNTADKDNKKEDIEQIEEANTQARNPYKWVPKKDEKDKKDKKKQEKRASSPSQDEHIKHVTKEFCDWVASLGGDSNNIEESTITSLFASGYETKPALSVPIHVVELTNVPPELRMSAAIPPAQVNKDTPAKETKKADWNKTGGYVPSWVKFQYGAWYLNPKAWKRRDADEQLRDPKEIKDQEMSEAKKKSNSLDAELAPMHGAKAFMEFIEKKNTRRPEVLENLNLYRTTTYINSGESSLGNIDIGKMYSVEMDASLNRCLKDSFTGRPYEAE